MQEVDETPDYTDSDTNPNTTESSVAGEPLDGRKKRSEANQLRRSIFGKKHDRLGESKVGNSHHTSHILLASRIWILSRKYPVHSSFVILTRL